MTIFVPGLPCPGGSKKAFFNKRTGRAMIVDAAGQRNKDWRASVLFAVRELIEPHKVMEGPLKVEVTFYMPRPKAHYGAKGLKDRAPVYHAIRPDATKLWRSTEDALTDAGVWNDDGQVSEQVIKKFWCEPRATGARIIIEQIASIEDCQPCA